LLYCGGVETRSVVTIVDALNRSNARYLIVGGLAVVAHGFVRLTADIDVVLDLESPSLPDALSALAGLGYKPRAPVDLHDFADRSRRAVWVREKGLTVFSLFSPAHPATEIDLFVDSPFEFDAVYARAVRVEISPDVRATFVGVEDLIAMKKQAARPQDLLDVERLNAIRDGSGGGQ
jgi:hypothetical protein